MSAPVELVAAARHLVGTTERTLGATVLTAAALLLRQAAEETLDGLWRDAAPGLETCSGRAQLIALPFYLDDRELARATVYAWNRLSELCHHDDGAVVPATRGELLAFADTISALVTGR